MLVTGRQIFWHSGIQAAYDSGVQQFHGFWPAWTSFGDDWIASLRLQGQ